MITGYVKAGREPIVRIAIQNAAGQSVDIEAVIDTGFDGSLTLSSAMIALLGLPWRSKGLALMANGQVDQCDLYAATVIWDGTPRNILVEAVESDPLLGTAMMRGYELRVQFLDNGDLTLEPISQQPTSSTSAI